MPCRAALLSATLSGHRPQPQGNSAIVCSEVSSINGCEQITAQATLQTQRQGTVIFCPVKAKLELERWRSG